MLTVSSHKGNANQNHTNVHLTPLKIAIIKNTTNNRCWRGWEENGNLTLLVGIQYSATTLENNMEAS
jgi:hypothetical protein